jgi:sugar phosphate isomerase/epimerase
VRIGVFDPVFRDLPLAAMLDHAVEIGVEAVEIGTGNYPGDAHCRPGELLASSDRLAAFAAAFSDRGLVISALACHGNPIHPDAERAAHDDAVYRDTVRLAAELGLTRVNLFSGCPGDGPRATHPNWVVTMWPPDFADLLRWQWDDVVVPYWREAGSFAADHGVSLGFEMHPGMVVYNPRSFMRLREAIGAVAGLNLDPSHLFWQGIDPIRTIEELGEVIVHVHAKDTEVVPELTSRNGVIDLTPAEAVDERSWRFRSVGEGHDVDWWTRLVGALGKVGYDHVLSIEHEDRLLSPDEGLRRAVAALRQALAAS